LKEFYVAGNRYDYLSTVTLAMVTLAELRSAAIRSRADMGKQR
jgi:hypothetical protein